MKKILYLVLLVFYFHNGYADVTLFRTFVESNDELYGHISFGLDVECIGDVNGDGYGDFVVSSYQHNTYKILVNIYYGGPEMDHYSDGILFEADDILSNAVDLIQIGDVNGDGSADFALNEVNNISFNGSVLIFFGGLEYTGFPNVELTGSDLLPFNGQMVAGAGDVNGDGFDDIIMGLPRYNDGQGRMVVYYGGIEMDSNPDLVLNGEIVYGPDGTGGSRRYISSFGRTVSGVGDVNGDGYDDVAVGRDYFIYQLENLYVAEMACRVFIYFGDAEPDTIPDLILKEGYDGEFRVRPIPSENYNFGVTIAGGGDINGDDFPDIVVGADEYSENHGRIYVYFGGMEIDSVADLTITNEEAGIGFARNSLGIGDVNGDDFDDVIVGATHYQSSTGACFLYYGSAEPDSVVDLFLIGEEDNNLFGLTQSSLSDISGDGYPDFIVGAIGYNNYRGRSYGYHGGPGFDETADFILSGEGSGNRFGRSVTDAGDVNGDGYDDVLVGADQYMGERGRAYLYHGGPEMDHMVDLVMTGEDTLHYFGREAASAGDVNGDGFHDVLIGAYQYGGLFDRTYLFCGGSEMDGTADLVFSEDSTYFGRAFCGGSDVNGDGYDDVFVNVFDSDATTGRVNVYFGGATIDNNADLILSVEEEDSYFGYALSGTGDVNGDGFDDLAVGAYEYNAGTGRVYIYLGGDGVDALPDAIIDGFETYGGFGYSLSGVGDVNGDGFDDLAVGAGRYDNLTGRVYIYYGGENVDDEPDVVMTGEDVNHYFGSSLSDAGDINGDGFDDVVIGAYRYDSNRGRTYVFLGGSEMDSVPDAVVDGEETGDEFGASVSGAGDIDGDGLDEIIVGAGYNRSNGKAYLYRFDSETAVDALEQQPAAWCLLQNYPNPFNCETTIRFQLTKPGRITLKIYNALGGEIKTLCDDALESGTHTIYWDADNMPSGIYFYRLISDQFVQTKKMILLK